jgi:hypothetical protein
MVLAVDDTEVGADGTDGTGGAGGSATASAVSADASNTANAQGGSGGAASPNGVGGGGGSASATAMGTQVVSGPASASAQANAGDGGTGGGTGGAGGSAFASASTSNNTNDPVSVTAVSVAGNAGLSYSASGQNGAAASLGTVYGSSSGGGNVSVYGEVVGGIGGSVNSGDGSNGAGVDESLTNAVDGDTTGSLFLTQVAAAGSGGQTATSWGTPGNASSTLMVTKNGLQDLTATTASFANQGGETYGPVEPGGNQIGTGGDATALTNATSDSNVSAFACANTVEGPIASLGYPTYLGRGVFASTANASATATGTGTLAGSSTVTASADAQGLVGGAPGISGGDAIASASASNAGPDPVTVSASATGGTGAIINYRVLGLSTVNPGNGSAAQIGTVYGCSTGGGNVFVSATQTGGAGGSDFIDSYYPQDTNTATGNGADSTLVNAVSGSTTGSLTLSQTATGGNSGYTNGPPGIAGNATSSLTFIGNGSKSLTGYSNANGGIGSPTYLTTGGAGGSASAAINLTGDSNMVAAAIANGGSGGVPNSSVNYAVTGSGGAGGSANATATGTGTGTASGSSAVSVQADANGGTGGSANSNYGYSWNGNGAAGGTATASASGTSAGPGGLVVIATGYGGNGGLGNAEGYVSGNGGSAFATASSTGSAPATITAIAGGGSGGIGLNGASDGTGGSATAVAIAGGLSVEQDSAAIGTVGGNAKVTITGSTITLGYPNNGALIVTGPSSASIGGIAGTGSLTVGDGTTSTILQLTANSGTSAVSSLIVNAGSVLDITNNHLIINYGASSDPVSSIAGWIASGYNGGGWDGLGIISSTAQAPTNGFRYGVGWADGADGIVSGLSSGQIEIKYTLLGDANLDGTVNGSDFSILAANFGLGVTNWDQGNFLYGSSVNGSDFSALAANFGQGDSGADVSVSQADIAALDAFAVANGLPLPMIGGVPEPGTGGLVVLSAIGWLGRRRRGSPRRESVSVNLLWQNGEPAWEGMALYRHVCG